MIARADYDGLDGIPVYGSPIDARFEVGLKLDAEEQPKRKRKSLATIPVRINLWLLLKKIILYLCPSFLSTRSTSSSSSITHHNQIAALDGLRGWACLFVFNEHLTYVFSRTFLFGYGYYDKRTTIQLPFVRIPWSGFSMVCIFYVISGYVLSYKPLKLIQAGKINAAQQAITSSLVRRPLRLYPPIFVAVFFIAMFLQLGAFEPARRVWWTNHNTYAFNEPPPPYVLGFKQQLIHAAWRCTIPLYIWDWSSFRSAGEYDRHTWTIVVEFRTSLILFLCLYATSRMTVRCRMIMLLSFMMYCFCFGRREVLTFTAGALLAQIDLLKKQTEPLRAHIPSFNNLTRRSSRSMMRLNQMFTLFCFILGLYLCSTPVIDAENTPGFQRIVKLIPEKYEDRADYIRTLGAVFTVYGSMHTPCVNSFFSSSLSNYLGKISYALYLVHGPVIRSLLYAAVPTIYTWTGDGSKAGQTTRGVVYAWILGSLLVVPLVFWLADLFWQFVDVPCVKFARKVEVLLTDKRVVANEKDASGADDLYASQDIRMKLGKI